MDAGCAPMPAPRRRPRRRPRGARPPRRRARSPGDCTDRLRSRRCRAPPEGIMWAGTGMTRARPLASSPRDRPHRPLARPSQPSRAAAFFPSKAIFLFYAHRRDAQRCRLCPAPARPRRSPPPRSRLGPAYHCRRTHAPPRCAPTWRLLFRAYSTKADQTPASKPAARFSASARSRTPEYTHGGRPGKSGFGAHLSVFFLGLWPPNSSVFWNGLLGPPGFIRFPVTASKNGNKIGKNPIFLLGSTQAVRTAPAIERSC